MGNNRSMPDAGVIPVLGYPDLDEAVAWLGNAFGFTVRLKIPGHRAQLHAGSGAVVVTAGTSAGRKTGHAVMVRVEGLDAHHQRAVAGGARILQPPAEHPYGERQYTAEDPAGYIWTFSESVRDVDPTDWGGILVNG